MSYWISIEGLVENYILTRKINNVNLSISIIIDYVFNLPPLYTCPFCGKVFNSEAGLKRHVKRTKECKRSLDEMISKVITIMKNINAITTIKSRGYECRVCGYRTKPLYDMVFHAIHNHPDLVINWW